MRVAGGAGSAAGAATHGVEQVRAVDEQPLDAFERVGAGRGGRLGIGGSVAAAARVSRRGDSRSRSRAAPVPIAAVLLLVDLDGVVYRGATPCRASPPSSPTASRAATTSST